MSFLCVNLSSCNVSFWWDISNRILYHISATYFTMLSATRYMADNWWIIFSVVMEIFYELIHDILITAVYSWKKACLTHQGWVTHICVSEIIIVGSDNGLSPGRRQVIIWTNAGILLIEPMRINFNEILIEINTFLFTKMHLKMSSAKWRLFRFGLNVLNVKCICTKEDLFAGPRPPAKYASMIHFTYTKFGLGSSET